MKAVKHHCFDRKEETVNIHALVDDFGDNEPYEVTLFKVSAVW